MQPERIVILGATGMLGHMLFSNLSDADSLDVYATVRHHTKLSEYFPDKLLKKISAGVDAEQFDTVSRLLGDLKPDQVINCIGLIKQLPEAQEPVKAISINALFPHKLAEVCRDIGARLIHLSTDCVFSGRRGMYTEDDQPDAADLYGRTKLLGEVAYPHCITLRTSIIGHELKGKFSLIEWFLASERVVKGYTHAIYSGFPTFEMARILRDYVIPDRSLQGLYHVSSGPISKFDLLSLVAKQYQKRIVIKPYEDYHCDRSLDSTRFRRTTGYHPPSWEQMIEEMHRFS